MTPTVTFPSRYIEQEDPARAPHVQLERGPDLHRNLGCAPPLPILGPLGRPVSPEGTRPVRTWRFRRCNPTGQQGRRLRVRCGNRTHYDLDHNQVPNRMAYPTKRSRQRSRDGDGFESVSNKRSIRCLAHLASPVKFWVVHQPEVQSIRRSLGALTPELQGPPGPRQDSNLRPPA